MREAERGDRESEEKWREVRERIGRWREGRKVDEVEGESRFVGGCLLWREEKYQKHVRDRTFCLRR